MLRLGAPTQRCKVVNTKQKGTRNYYTGTLLCKNVEHLMEMLKHTALHCTSFMQLLSSLDFLSYSASLFPLLTPVLSVGHEFLQVNLECIRIERCFKCALLLLSLLQNKVQWYSNYGILFHHEQNTEVISVNGTFKMY